MTQCNQECFEFEAHFSRQLMARFDGGTMTSDGGALLLRQTDQRLNLLTRLAACFEDRRSPWLISHRLEELVSQRYMDWRWATRISAIMISCGKIHCWRC
jgi:hypothetical protein